MSVMLDLAPDTEQHLRSIARQRGQSLEEYLRELADNAARTCNGSGVMSPESAQSASERERAWLAWVASHPKLPYIADDSRESIYEGRGE
jgi:hypothetical protein